MMTLIHHDANIVNDGAQMSQQPLSPSRDRNKYNINIVLNTILTFSSTC